jgi:hypothetical protein
MTRDQTTLEQLPQIWSFYRSFHTPKFKKKRQIQNMRTHRAGSTLHSRCDSCIPLCATRSNCTPVRERDMGLRGLQVVIAQLAVFRESKGGSNEQ